MSTETAPRPRRRASIVVGLIGVLVGVALGGVATWITLDGGNRGTAGDPGAAADLSVAADRGTPSVVRVDVRGIGADGATGNASGVVIDGQGHIITNNHVVAGATSMSVTFSDNNTAPATLVGTDPSTDLAVIEVRAVDGAVGDTTLSPVDFGDASDVAVGQPAIAIGSAFGLDGTVTSGIISALDRPVDLRGIDGQTVRLPGVIQTDARISPGNSGGPLLDIEGRLIGVNSSILGAETRGDVGFAIPVDVVTEAVQALLDAGQGGAGEGATAAAYLGVAAVESEIGGAVVDDVVPGSPADAAGLVEGDRIIGLAGEQVSGVDALVSLVRDADVGGSVEVTYTRQGVEATTAVTLSDGPP